MSQPLLSVQNLSVAFETRRGLVNVIEDLSFELHRGRTLGIVGESGSGKSVTSLAIMGLLPPTARPAGKVLFDGKDLLKSSEGEMQKLRGGRLSMIFQDPMTSLNPSFTVGFQIEEALRTHGVKGNLQEKAADLLKQVGIPDPALRLSSYPHQLSGGMSQRVMIAMSIACSPDLLIADEPTTALDVTIQAQILALLKQIQVERKMGLILITHDIGVVAQMADDILVMYAGHVMEAGPKEEVIRRPKHPYTQALLASLPGSHSLGEFRSRLPTIPGLVPDLLHRPPGCQLNPRCPYVIDTCKQAVPEARMIGATRVRCIRQEKTV
ncbi:MAG TPA: ABC transporter ATP-binding protein [Bdellovibrionales bacterium]|nr:ABC transporter ATP-binding protein [Bdellovibrionales bacterium]